ncbi:EthD family reductase [Modestobacter sp. SSW1-42]|uniref:EthD family reductase n=1 Tax=Modestobacter sp. SSW1-42 TaxID=596372 RepID=UPI003987545A
MTVSYFALYQTPDDPAAFEERYAAVHAGLVEHTAGLVENRVHAVTRQVVGKPAYHLVAEFVFDSQEALDAALDSAAWSSAWDDVPGGADSVAMFAAHPHGAGATDPR